MTSTFFGLNIARTGLSGYQASINTTAHNISNAATVGYSRQQVLKQASPAQRTYNSYGTQGSGVDITGIERMRNGYYDDKYWSNGSYYGQYAAKYDYMRQIENYFNEVNTDGFTTEFNNLFNSFVDLTSEPDGADKRVTTVSYAGSLTDYFNALSGNLSRVQEDANDQIKSVCNRINSIADQILSLNKQIQTIEVNKEKANDLRDQRDVLVDELSQYVNVQVKETDVYVTGATDWKGDPLKAGITDFAVYINDQLLVDSLSSNHLLCTPREYKVNLNDCIGLYEVTWNFPDGDKFDMNSSGMDGELKGLFDIRDGNNLENFRGTVTADRGDTTVTVQADIISDIERLNIPSEGLITIGSYEYSYNDFTINYDADGNIESYTFNLDSPVKADANDVMARIGEGVDFKGIPYYQQQLNEFVRTFAQEFNFLHNQGIDAHGNAGQDFFTTVNPTTGADMVLNEKWDAALAGTSVSAKDYSYYRMTAANISVNQAITKDSSMVCTRREEEQGVASCELLKEIVKLKDKQDMFSQGNPAQYLQAVTADISVDCSKAKNFEKSLSDVLQAIDNQRKSISGVDTNEELAQLVIYRNGYNLCSKMISVLNQIYDKLINGTGV